MFDIFYYNLKNNVISFDISPQEKTPLEIQREISRERDRRCQPNSLP